MSSDFSFLCQYNIRGEGQKCKWDKALCVFVRCWSNIERKSWLAPKRPEWRLNLLETRFSHQLVKLTSYLISASKGIHVPQKLFLSILDTGKGPRPYLLWAKTNYQESQVNPLSLPIKSRQLDVSIIVPDYFIGLTCKSSCMFVWNVQHVALFIKSIL